MAIYLKWHMCVPVMSHMWHKFQLPLILLQLSEFKCYRPANILNIFLPEKWIKNMCLSLNVCISIVEKDPIWVCNDRYTSAGFGQLTMDNLIEMFPAL